jgi:hypothetical protein
MNLTTLVCAALAASILVGQFAAADHPRRNNYVNKRPHTQQERIRKQAAEPTQEHRDSKQLDQAGEESREQKPDAPQR